MENKTRFIAPTIMLIAGAIASIIMLIKNYDFYTMLWGLLIVLVVFYVIGDVVRYLYASVRPCILPQPTDLEQILATIQDEEDDEAVEVDKEASEETDNAYEQDADAYDNTEDLQADENAESFDGAYEDSDDEEYTDEKLDEM